jgi:hypothetical protein
MDKMKEGFVKQVDALIQDYSLDDVLCAIMEIASNRYQEAKEKNLPEAMHRWRDIQCAITSAQIYAAHEGM